MHNADGVPQRGTHTPLLCWPDTLARKDSLAVRSARYSTIRLLLISKPSDPQDMADFVDGLPLPVALTDTLAAAMGCPCLLYTELNNNHAHPVF